MRYSFLLTALSALLLVAALWAYSTGHFVVATIGTVVALGLLFAVVVRGLRRASAVIDGADRMIDKHRARDAHSRSVDA